MNAGSSGLALSFLLCAVLILSACSSRRPADVYDLGAYSKPGQKQKKPSFHKVRKGETLYSIAFRYGLDYKTLARWNHLPSSFLIYPGQKLYFYQTRSAVTKTVSQKRAAKNKTSNVSQKPAGQTKKNSPNIKATLKKPPAKAASEPIGGKISWQWPVKGKVLTTFVAGDTARKGIDIAGRSGQPVYAASSGTVVYSGNGLRGYGELIIIKHQQGYLSAYAHNRKRHVQEGDAVKKGQAIAELGDSGTDGSKLHFEIRLQGKPVDPMKFLP